MILDTIYSELIMPTFKPDSSFFRKIAIGAVGTRAVCEDLNQHQHTMAELERGSTDTKLWKDVKRKRVRIPDLVCTTCGLRIESRAKSKPELSMSHSPTENERSWDFGMVDTDVVAFPVCGAVGEHYWSRGKLNEGASYWHERNWVKWQAEQHVNYFSVAAFRATPFMKIARKGVTGGIRAYNRLASDLCNLRWRCGSNWGRASFNPAGHRPAHFHEGDKDGTAACCANRADRVPSRSDCVNCASYSSYRFALSRSACSRSHRSTLGVPRTYTEVHGG